MKRQAKGNKHPDTAQYMMVIEESGSICFVNDSLKDLLGREDGDLDGSSLFEYLAPSDNVQLRELMEDVQPQPGLSRLRLSLENGELHEINWEVSVLQTPLWHPRKFLLMGSQCLPQRATNLEAAAGPDLPAGWLDQAQTAILLQDFQGTLMYANERLHALLAATTENADKQHALQQLWKTILQSGADFPGGESPIYEALQKGQATRQVQPLCLPGGQYAHYLIDSVPLFDSGPSAPYGVLSTLTDITGPLSARGEDREKAIWSASMVNHMQSMHWVMDKAGKICFANAAFNRFFAVGKTLQGVLLQEIVPAEVSGMLMEQARRVMETGSSWQAVQPFRGPNGQQASFMLSLYSPGDPSGQVVAAEAWDITDRYQLHWQLKNLHERILHFSGITTDSIWEWDIETGEIFRNQALMSLIGFQTDKAQDLSWWFSRIHPADRARVEGEINYVMANREASWKTEYKFRTADGTYRLVADRGFVIYEQNRAVKMVGSLHGISAESRIEELISREKNGAHAGPSPVGQPLLAMNPPQEGLAPFHQLTWLLASAHHHLDRMEAHTPETRTSIQQASLDLAAAMEQTRRLSEQQLLRAISNNPLLPLMENHLRECCDHHHIRFKCSIHDQPQIESLPTEKKITLFKVMQEQLANIIRHSRAEHIRMFLRAEHTGIILYIYDDGIGFDVKTQIRGKGLNHIFSSMNQFGGSADIISARGEGCSLTVLMPFDRSRGRREC